MANEVTPNPKPHVLTLTLSDGRLEKAWKCNAPKDADCHKNCPQGCESWSYTDHEHELVTEDYCLTVEWLSELDLEDCHEGEAVIFSGPVDTEYDGENWTFAI